MPDIEWIRIKTGIFDDEKIKIIEQLPDADTLLVLWIKLICLAGRVNDNGFIYINPNLPYGIDELVAVLKRPIKTVELAISTFKRLNMIEVHEDGTLFLTNWAKNQNVDALAKIKEDGRKRVARFREKHKMLTSGNVTVTLRNELEKNKNRKEEDIEEETPNWKKSYEEKRYNEIDIITPIGTESLDMIIRFFTGEQPCHEVNKKIYREACLKLGIDIDSLITT